MPHDALWYNDIHRPLDARTPTQAMQRARQIFRGYRHPYLNVWEAQVMERQAEARGWTLAGIIRLAGGEGRDDC